MAPAGMHDQAGSQELGIFSGKQEPSEWSKPGYTLPAWTRGAVGTWPAVERNAAGTWLGGTQCAEWLDVVSTEMERI